MPILLGGGLSSLWAALLLAVLPVTVKTNSGESLQGQLQGFTDSAVRLDTAGQMREIAYEDLTLLQPARVEEKTGPDYRVTLVGGSQVAAQSVQMTDGEVVIEPRRQPPLKLPAKQVRAVRFRRAAAQTDAQWLGNLERESRGDTLVIRRPGDRLDPQQGVVLSIGDGVVGFDLDGTKVDAPIQRLEGIILGGTENVADQAQIQVVDVYGSRWMGEAIETSQADQPLQLRLNSGITHAIPLDQVASIRWSSGVQWLARSEPVEQSSTPYVATNVDGELFNQFFGAAAQGETELSMYGGSFVEYRIESGFQRLAGSVRRHPDVARTSQVSVAIELDGKTVWQQSLQDEQPKGFDVPVNDARRLKIRVASGDDGDVGDQVQLLRPRLLK